MLTHLGRREREREQMKVVQLKKQRVIILLGASCFLLFLAASFYRIVQQEYCSEEDSREFLRNLCELYRQRKIVGNLCDGLCLSKSIEYRHCDNYPDGKVVLITKIGHRLQYLVLKSSRRNFTDYHSLSFFDKNTTLYPDLATFDMMIRNLIQMNTGANISENVNAIEKVWFADLYREIKLTEDAKLVGATLDSIWSLVQQNEYLLIRLNQHLEYFPKMYGACGFVYGIEYAPPRTVLSVPFKKRDSSSWRQKVDIALGILDVVQSLEDDFSELYHFCDVKEENFGVADKKVKLIDADSLFPDSVLLSDLEYPNCTHHHDCDFFDCKGRCDMKKKKCMRERVNNNLQVVCEKIFLGRYSFLGMLRSPPILLKRPLHSLLQQCAYPGGQQDSRSKTPKSVFHKLYVFLNETINTN